MNRKNVSTVAACITLTIALSIGHATAGQNVDFPKGDAAWTVTIEHQDRDLGDPAEAAAQGKVWEIKRDIVRTGTARRDRVTWSNGKTTETWWYTGDPQVYMSKSPISGRMTYLAPDETTSDKLLDETFFKWTASAKPAGEEKVGGTKCLVYAARVKRDMVEEDLQVWIDEETNRPVAISVANVKYHYIFNETPKEQLELPQELVDRVKRVRAIAGLEP